MEKCKSLFLKSILFTSAILVARPSFAHSFHHEGRNRVLEKVRDSKRAGRVKKYLVQKSHRVHPKRMVQGPFVFGSENFSPAVQENLRANEIVFDGPILEKIRKDRPDAISISVTTPDGPLVLELVKVDLTPSSFRVVDENGVSYQSPFKPAYYRGVVEGKDNSLVSLSISRGRVMAIVSVDGHEYNLGNMENSSSENLPMSPVSNEDPSKPVGDVTAMVHDLAAIVPPNNGCGEEELVAPAGVEQTLAGSSDGEPSRSPAAEGLPINTSVLPVGVYVVADYDMYVKNNSSVADTTTFITGLFNQVAALYANEGIAIQVAGVKVHTSTDPYATLTGSSAYLMNFANNMYPTSFPGALAHLLSTRPAGLGGIAYVGGVCSKSSGYGFSNIYNNYSAAPTFSWSVQVITHEIGHNLGSKHTHWCGWAGGAIDGCYQTENYNGFGTCGTSSAPGCYLSAAAAAAGNCTLAPIPWVAKGSIMSYCHIKGGTNPATGLSYNPIGISFNNGFGPLPGKAIRDGVAAAACLQTTYVPDTTAPTVTITSPAASATVSGVVGIGGVATDNVGPSLITITVDGVAAQTVSSTPSIGGKTVNYYYSWDSTKVANGLHTISVKAQDEAANVSSVVTRQVTVSNAGGGVVTDTTPPTVAFSAPAASASVSGTITLTATASDSGSGIKTIQFYNGTTAIGGAGNTSPYSITYNTDSLAVGTISLKVTATDNDGNSASSTRSFTHVDVTAPTVSLTAPLASAVVSGTITLSATATDTGGSGMSKVDFYRGTTLIASDTTSPYSVSLNTTTLSDGAYSLKARATDKSGNFTDSTVVSVQVKNTIAPVVDTTAPSIQLASHSSGAKILAWSSNVLTADVADDSGVSKVEFLVNSTVVCTITSGAYECPFATSQRKKSFTIQVRATDNSAAKNVGTISVTLGSE